MRRTSLAAPLLLIAIGALLLARNIYPDLPIADYIARYWPFVLIAWGGLRVIEILYWSATSKPLPAQGISGGEWIAIVLLCLFGAGLHAARSFTGTWEFHIPWGNVDLFGERYEYPVNAQRPASANARIIIDDFRGDIRIVGSESNAVTVVGRKLIGAIDKQAADRADAATEIELGGESNELTVRLRDDYHGPARVSTSLDISVPKGAHIEAKRRDGDLRVSSVDGPVAINGRGTDIDLENLNGPVSINGNFAGTLHAHNVSQRLSYKRRGLEFQVEKAAGDLRVDRGDFVASNITGPVNISSRSNDVKVTGFTNSLNVALERGDLELEPGRLPLSPIQARSRSGDIRLALPEGASFTLNATTESGDISNSFGGGLKQETSGGHRILRGSVGSGPAINLETRRGDIAIRKSGAIEVSGPLQKIEQ